MAGASLFGRTRGFVSRHRCDLAGLFVIVVLAALFLSPALKDGTSFGPFDYDSSLTPFTAGLYSAVHSPFNGDAVSQMISWNALDWQFIHHGQFPLWNPYSALGMPQFFNFESSVLSLPDVVSYLFPVRDAFLVVVFMKLVLAGTGTFVCCRVMRLRPIAALFGGITFMFAGAFVNWVTWPLSDVVAWSGWICAFGILAYRSTRPRVYVVLLAVATAFSIFGGFPEANVMFAMAIGAAIIGGLLAMALLKARISIRGCVRVGFGAVAGVALAAPLWLPGLGVVAVAHREQEGHYKGLPVRALPTVISQGYFGLPVGTLEHSFQLTRWNYYETVAYVGLFAVALVFVAVFGAWRRPIVIALIVATAFSFIATYEPVGIHPFQSIVDHLPQISAIRFERMRSVTAFLMAVLAAVGFDTVIGRIGERAVRRTFVVATACATVLVGFVVVISDRDHLVGSALTQRKAALVWPVVLAVVLGGATALAMIRKSLLFHRAAVATLLIGQTAFLFAAGVGIPSYSKLFYAPTPALTQLKEIVGSNLVGLDGGNTTNVRFFRHVGLYPNMNIGYQIHLFGVHDPLFPTAYLASWPFASAAPQELGVGLFVPDIDSLALARRYGIDFVLAGPGLPAPTGMRKVTVLAGETLYSVPGAAQFSFVDTIGDRVVAETGNGDGRYEITVAAPRGGTFIARVTAFAGWHASVDGQPVAVRTYDKVMESFNVPAGSHVIDLSYWPRRLTEGLVLAVGGAVALALFAASGGVASLVMRRRTRRSTDHSPR